MDTVDGWTAVLSGPFGGQPVGVKMKSAKERIRLRLEKLEKELEQQRLFETYEYMERPEIAVFAKGRATAYQNSIQMLKTAMADIEGIGQSNGKRICKSKCKSR